MTHASPAEGSSEQTPRRRRHRRATGGVPPVPPGTVDPGAAVTGEPVVPRRSADDEDTGWGETPTGNDERLLRDVPPHW